LSPAAARRVGNYYSENEFHINRLQHLRSRMVEVGRSCIHPDHRSGAVITLLWAGLADYMVSNNYDYLIGCASIGMADGGHNAANLFSADRPDHMAPAEYRVFPQHGLPFRTPGQRPAGAGAAADQGLPARRRLGLRRAGLGSRLQHRRPAAAAADVAHESALHAPLRQTAVECNLCRFHGRLN
jgi:hypothetical protein